MLRADFELNKLIKVGTMNVLTVARSFTLCDAKIVIPSVTKIVVKIKSFNMKRKKF